MNQFKNCLEKLATWLFFGVIISIIPLIARFIGMALRNNEPTIVKVICNGELLIICVGMLAVAIGEVITWNANHKLVKIILSGTSLVLLGLTIFIFADISNISSKQQSEPQTAQSSNINNVVPNKNTLMVEPTINSQKTSQPFNQNEIIFDWSFLIYFFSLATSACCIALPETNV